MGYSVPLGNPRILEQEGEATRILEWVGDTLHCPRNLTTLGRGGREQYGIHAIHVIV